MKKTQIKAPDNPLLDKHLNDDPRFDPADLKTPYTHRGTGPDKWDEHHAMRLETAKEAIGELYPGCMIFGITKGQFSLIQTIEAILDQTGPAEVFISTWTAANNDMTQAHALLESGKMTDVKFLVDASFQRRAPGLAHSLREKFGPRSIRVTRNHAKFVMIKTKKWNLVMVTSMNMNQNPRLEDFFLLDNPGLAEYLTGLMEEIFNRIKVSDIEKMAKFHQKRFDSLK